jgi:hypothetical protein
MEEIGEPGCPRARARAAQSEGYRPFTFNT